MRHWANIAMAVAFATLQNLVSAQETKPAAGTNAPPEVKVQMKRFTDQGRDLGAFITLNAGDEVVGFQIPEKCRTRSEGVGQIIVIEDENPNNTVSVYYNDQSAFNVEMVKEKLKKRYPTARTTAEYESPVMSTNALNIELTYLSSGEPVMVKTVSLPCKSGELTLTASTTAEGKSMTLSLLNKIIISLQLGATEKELKRPKPVLSLSE